MKAMSVPFGPRTSASEWILPSTPFNAKSRALQPKAQMPVLLNAIMRPPHIEQPALPYPWGKHLANKVKGGIKTRRKTAGLRPQAEATTSRYTSSSSNRINPGLRAVVLLRGAGKPRCRVSEPAGHSVRRTSRTILWQAFPDYQFVQTRPLSTSNLMATSSMSGMSFEGLVGVRLDHRQHPRMGPSGC